MTHYTGKSWPSYAELTARWHRGEFTLPPGVGTNPTWRELYAASSAAEAAGIRAALAKLIRARYGKRGAK